MLPDKHMVFHFLKGEGDSRLEAQHDFSGCFPGLRSPPLPLLQAVASTSDDPDPASRTQRQAQHKGELLATASETRFCSERRSNEETAEPGH